MEIRGRIAQDWVDVIDLEAEEISRNQDNSHSRRHHCSHCLSIYGGGVNEGENLILVSRMKWSKHMLQRNHLV